MRVPGGALGPQKGMQAEASPEPGGGGRGLRWPAPPTCGQHPAPRPVFLNSRHSVPRSRGPGSSNVLFLLE